MGCWVNNIIILNNLFYIFCIYISYILCNFLFKKKNNDNNKSDSDIQGEISHAHESSIWDMQYHPLGHLFVSGSNDHTTK